MPRNYQRKTCRRSWNQEQLTLAKEAVGRGESVRHVSKTFDIPRTTLQDHILGKVATSKLGPRETVFNSDQETELVNHLLDLESRFYGITMDDVRKLAFELAERNGMTHPFNRQKKIAGCAWLSGFMKRNPNLTFRKAEATSAARARAFNEVSVNAFFDMYEGVLERMKFSPNRVYNADETAISTVPPSKKKIAALKGKKQVGIISSAERGETTTVVMSMSASGHHIPPFVIFPRARMNDALQHGAPTGTKFACNPSGYMTIEVFKTWFDHFLEHVHATEADPVLLLLDGHSSHTKNLALTEKARKEHVTIVVLPPHCTNRLQPLDVSFMGPFKAYYSSAAEVFLRFKPGHVITQYDIMQLMCTAFEQAATIPTAVNGFKICGLWPCDRSVFNKSSFTPSLVTDQALPNDEVEPVSRKQHNALDTTAASGTIDDTMDDSQQSAGSSFMISPEKILPLPKMTAPRVTKRKRPTEKAAEITSDSYRQSLIDAQASKDISLIKKSKKTAAKKCVKPPKRPKPNVDLDDSLCDRCGMSFSDSINGEGWRTCTSCKTWIHEECYEDSDMVCIYCSR